MTWHRVDLPPETRSYPALVDGHRLLLTFIEGQWWAIEDRCTHAGCAFSSDGEIDGHIAVCNCHGSEFDIRTGQVLVFPASEPLPTFPVRQSGDGLEVEL